jgi:hypothetical protein
MIPVNIKEKATYHSCVIAQVQYTMSLFKFVFSFQVLSIILVRLILVRMPPHVSSGLRAVIDPSNLVHRQPQRSNWQP